MNSSLTVRNHFFPTSALATIFAAAAAGIARNLRERRDIRREQRRQRRAIRQLRGIHNHTLRDIGIDRSEIASLVIHGREGR